MYIVYICTCIQTAVFPFPPILEGSVVDSHHGFDLLPNADPDTDLDSTYHPEADPDSTYHTGTDPDPDPDPGFPVKAQTLKKVLNRLKI
jgi:hypothetical protein